MGKEAALTIYRFLAEHVKEQTHSCRATKIVYYSHRVDEGDMWVEDTYIKKVQNGIDIGDRMSAAFAETFSIYGTGPSVGLVGTDLYPLPPHIIDDGFAMLEGADVVIGPAADGGYYFIGMKKLYPQLFESISWSTSDVFSATMAKCKSLKLKVRLLPVLSDIDTEDDVKNSGLLSALNPKK
jgi:hypothetical protein